MKKLWYYNCYILESAQKERRGREEEKITWKTKFKTVLKKH
jgi:hypothetical protein